ncbi:MAG: hypothetical protein DMF88_12180, partial [Acidobacteria bacterium]
MRLVIVRPMLLLCAILLLPAFVFAQEAVLTGTITDATGAVLPGVTVQATHESSGNTFEAVTDGRGVYRIPARIGTYKITAQLTGFGVATRQGVELLVGQTLTLNLQMSPSTLPGTAERRAQLDVAGAARAGQPDERGGRDARAGSRRCPRVQPERRRHAGQREHGRGQPAAVQQRRDRRVPVHLEPLRCNPGPIVGRTGERDHEVGHQPAVGIAHRQLPQQQLERTRSRAQSRAAVQEPADQRNGRRADRAEQDAFLRQLRVRAPAADLDLEHAIPGIQRHADRHAEREDVGHSHRSGALVEDAAHGQGGALASDRAIRRRRQHASRRHDDQHRAQHGRAGLAHDGAQQPRGERRSGRICLLWVLSGHAGQLVEALAGGQRHHVRLAAHHVPRLFNPRQREPAALPEPERLFVPRRLHVLLRSGRPSRPESRRRVPSHP